MTTPLTTTQLNPFEDDVVREPRDISFSVPGLNDLPLDALLHEFGALDAGVPRALPARAARARLLVSPDRGYGKSHLLGRLFAKLGRRATKVYLRPFQDPFKAWHSILLQTIQELNCPDDEKIGFPSQLQAMALGTLAHVVADFAGDVEARSDAPLAVARLRALASGALAHAEKQSLTVWLDGLFAEPGAVARLSHHMKGARGIDLHGREKAWMQILAACAFAEAHGDKRSAALKWIRAEPLEDQESKLLGLTAADNEGRGDSSAQEINDLSFKRLRGFCLLSSYYRPFIFCFDQTEFFAGDPALVKAFGNCIEKFFADLRNHVTVITANQENWVTEILPRIDPAQRARIAPELPLRGIKVGGARDLVTERLRSSEVGENDIKRFFADGWLEQLFDPVSEHGVRVVLQRAGERFRMFVPQGHPPPSRPSLDDLFTVEINNVRSKKGLMAYSQDALMWFVKDVGAGMEGVAVKRARDARYFSLEWRWVDRCARFAFEGGDHWRRWQAIADEATRTAQADAAPACLAYVFRTPDLAKIPRPSWVAAKPSVNKAVAHGFRIFDLTVENVCAVHAARELYSNALQGNIDYAGPETLAWLQRHFTSFLHGLAFPAASQPPVTKEPPTKPPESEAQSPHPSAELDAGPLGIVLAMVREQRVVDISAVLARLENTGLRDPLLRSVEAHPNLKAHPGPKTIFLQWRQTP